jgi:hypothetical protein
MLCPTDRLCPAGLEHAAAQSRFVPTDLQCAYACHLAILPGLSPHDNLRKVCPKSSFFCESGSSHWLGTAQESETRANLRPRRCAPSTICVSAGP